MHLDLTKADVTDSGKQSSLSRCGINYVSKKFNSTITKCLSKYYAFVSFQAK